MLCIIDVRSIEARPTRRLWHARPAPFRESGFFPALSRRQRDHRRTKTTTGSFALNGMRTFLQKARGKIGRYAIMHHTRAIQYAGNWSWRGWLMDLPGTDLCRRNAATFIPSNEQSKSLSARTYDLRFRESLFDAWDEKCVLHVSLLSSLPVEI